MADDIDMANDLIDSEVSRALSKLRQNAAVLLKAANFAWNAVIICRLADRNSVLNSVFPVQKMPSAKNQCLLIIN